MSPVESLLRRAIGLDTASIGPTLIERTVRRRMKALGFADETAYLEHVNTTPAEWEELIEAVVVPETWFFRDHAAFRTFVELVQQALLAPRNTPLRVLSVPCASGEEPSSLAMALLDAGVAREAFAIDAADISARALERAQRGLYGKNAFRGKALNFRDRHFEPMEAGYLLHQDVRDCVSFQRGNLLEENFLSDQAPYDFIFCRNLLIYFDRATQGRALQRLHRLLLPSGVLFVGPAELPQVGEHGFSPIGIPMVFACRRTDAPNGAVRLRPARRTASRQPPRLVTATAPDSGFLAPDSESASGPAQPNTEPVKLHPETVPADLEQARRLADAGQFPAAAALCEAHINSNGPTAQAYYLMGLLRDADGDPTAMDFYRKAIYLEPHHHDTLVQMALLLERKGDSAGARTLKRRAERVRQKTSMTDGSD